METLTYGKLSRSDLKTGVQSFEARLADGRTVTLPPVDVGYWLLDQVAQASLPAGDPSGQLRRVTDSVRGLWMFQGTQWFQLAGECVNAREFGAHPDNSAADNDTALAAAIAALSTGGVLYIPRGTYSVSAALSIPADTCVMGAGYDTVLNCATADINVLAAASVAGVRICDLRINNNGSGSSDYVGNAIHLNAVTDFVIENVWVENANSGIVIRNGSSRGQLRRIIAQDMAGSVAAGIYIVGSTRIAIDGVLAYESGAGVTQYPIHTNSDDAGVTICSDITITNVVSHLSGSTVGQGINVTYCDRVSVTNCTMTCTVSHASADLFGLVFAHVNQGTMAGNVVTGGDNGGYGYAVTDTSLDVAVVGNVAQNVAGGIHINLSRDVSCINNVINTTRDAEGILYDYGSITTVNSVVAGNVIGAAATVGISCSNLRSFRVTGNLVSGAGNIGINIADSDEFSCNDNSVVASSIDGIVLSTVSQFTCNGNLLSDNNSSNTASTHGIDVEGSSSHGMISGNTCRNRTGSGHHKYGIALAAGGSNMSVMGNHVEGNDTGGVSDGATSTIVRNNRGFVTENKGTDTVANGTTSTTVTHGLDYTPALGEIAVVGGEDPSNAVGTIWVDTIGATTFQVNVENDPGASGWDFGWRVAKV